MALQATGLPTVAAATAELWPSVANSVTAPWRRSSTPSRTKPSGAQPRPVAQQERLRTLSTKATTTTTTRLPDFLRDAVLAQQPAAILNVANLTPTNIRSEISNMSSRSLATANPVLRRPFQMLAARPLGALPMFRSMHTYQNRSSPTRAFAWLSSSSFSSSVTSPQQQYRGFGTGGMSRSLLASREAAANRNPNSASAQNAFYQALLKANMPAIVVERYQSGRFATSDVVEESYQTALTMLNGGSALGSVANMGIHRPGGLSPTEVQAIGQAVAANTRGGSVAISKGAQGPGTKDGPIHVVVNESMGGSVFRWIKFVLWFGLITYLSLIVVTMLVDGLNTFKRPGMKTDNSEAKAENQKARFSDVHGCDEAKEELQELVEFLRNPEKFDALGGKLPKGVLLVGPPGTGKTLLARAVAGEAGVPFFYMSGSEFDEIYVGVGAKRVRELFAAAKAKSPAIVFIDELDAIGGRRNSRDAAYVKQTLNQLLTELDGFDQNSGVVIIGATNFPELLDKALVRPGRFDRHVVVELPDVRGRIAILKHHAKKIKVGSDVNIEAIAGRTSGLSGAELENIVNQAAVHASKIKNKFVTQKDFEWAKDKVIMGAERRSMVISEKEKEMTAYHEAGHALVAFYAKNVGSELYKVTVLPRGQSLGHTATLPEMDKYSYTVKDFMAQLDCLMGGKAAEELVYGPDLVTGGVSSDLEGATKIAWMMVAQLGMSENLGPVEYLRKYNTLSSETKAMVESEVKRVLDSAYGRARHLLLTKRTELDLLAKALVEYETLDKAEVAKVIRGEKITNRTPVPPGPMSIPKPQDSLGGVPGIGSLPGETTAGDGSSGAPPPPPVGGIAA